ncbi:hypothetical protein BkAM31D_13000 [Halalkalibacter krulwichiae]|uniref:Uncharacterized protein n=1 Tax=Halalkalibacter krulwichiae TaxID=199441 RepID=A0A1X9MDG4_9BACI|nr:hypothetical protein [Halalkalibacter krulwichiae]ARK30674.1 hypothetical protein BkAM31D_13000 [Halalkalibacter krulwichiae]
MEDINDRVMGNTNGSSSLPFFGLIHGNNNVNNETHDTYDVYVNGD